MVSYDVLVIVQIRSGFATMRTGPGGDVWLEKRLTLPFNPCGIHEIADGNDEIPARELYWFVKPGEFRIYREDDTLTEEARRSAGMLNYENPAKLAELEAEWRELGYVARAAKSK